ncbi:MAG TPA: hypothetical protein VMJ75_01095 [Candidatus Acidoferrales bacterium]|nr:hypothetical protein [Candidatus Acidoferrales bacterium]
MKDAQALEFFTNIQARTEAGKVPWQPTADENEYVASVGGEFSLGMTRLKFLDAFRREAVLHKLTMKDKENRRLITADENVEGISEEQMRAFFVMVERQALGVGEKLGRLLDQLDRA